jgi:hypothetical protein
MGAIVVGLLLVGLTAADPPADQIQRWVADLDGESFAARESAEANLLKAGKAAVPTLTAAASEGRPESAARAIRVLNKLALGKDADAAKEAKAALVKLAGADSQTVVDLAKAALRTHLQPFIDELEASGAEVRLDGETVVFVGFDNARDIEAKLPLLKNFPGIEEVSLANAQVTDKAIPFLKGLPKLERVNLFTSSVGDAGMKVLKDIPTIKSLPIGKTKVTNAGLAHLKDMKQLEYIGLRGDDITDAGLAHLKGLTNLTGLHLAETKVTDAGLAQLKTLTKMRYLRVNNTKITDAGLEHFKALTSLERLDIWNTKATDKGIEKLKEAMPQTVILTEAQQ